MKASERTEIVLRVILRLMLIEAVIAIALVTLTPAGGPRGGMNPLCFTCGEWPLADRLRNVILFLPFGFLAFQGRPSILRVALWGAALSLAIEIAQLYIPGRNPALADLLANGAGAALGAWVALGLRTGALFRGTSFYAATAAVAAVLAASSWLLVPSPPSGGLWAQWSPRMAPSGGYPGRILAATLGDIPLTPGPIPADLGAASSLLEGEPLVIRFVASEPPRWAPVLIRLVSRRGPEALILLRVQHPDLLVQLPYRANAIGLEAPVRRVPGVFTGVIPGETASLALSLGPDGGMRVMGPAGESRAPGPDPSAGWHLLLSLGRPALATGVTLAWCAGLFFVPAFLAPRVTAAVAAVVLLVALMAVLPVIVPYTGAPALIAWAGALGGTCVGWWVRSRTSPRSSDAVTVALPRDRD